MDGSQEDQRVANLSNTGTSVTAQADTMGLQPSASNLSTAPSMENTSDNLEELEAEAMRLRVENERVEWKWRQC